MTEQYLNQNINTPRTPRRIVNTVADPGRVLLADDSLVTFDTTAFVGGAALPRARECPGLTITLVALTGAVNNLNLLTQGGDALVLPSSLAGALPLTTNNAVVAAQSDGVSSWHVLFITP